MHGEDGAGSTSSLW